MDIHRKQTLRILDGSQAAPHQSAVSIRLTLLPVAEDSSRHLGPLLVFRGNHCLLGPIAGRVPAIILGVGHLDSHCRGSWRHLPVDLDATRLLLGAGWTPASFRAQGRALVAARGLLETVVRKRITGEALARLVGLSTGSISQRLRAPALDPVFDAAGKELEETHGPMVQEVLEYMPAKVMALVIPRYLDKNLRYRMVVEAARRRVAGDTAQEVAARLAKMKAAHGESHGASHPVPRQVTPSAHLRIPPVSGLRGRLRSALLAMARKLLQLLA